MSKGLCVSPGGEGANFAPPVIDARVKECEEGQFNQPTRTGGHSSGILRADPELDVIEKLCIFEEGARRVWDCTTGRLSMTRKGIKSRRRASTYDKPSSLSRGMSSNACCFRDKKSQNVR